MPKAQSTAASHTLRRNQACHTCRKKKLKCDAARPYCGACVKAHQGKLLAPVPDGFILPPEPECSYDPIEGLRLADSVDPVAKIRELESTIAELRRKLIESGISPNSPLSSDNSSTNIPISKRLPGFVGDAFPVRSTAELGINRSEISLPRAGLDVGEGLQSTSPASLSRSVSSSPDLASTSPGPFLQLLFSGWNPDLPDPAEMKRLVDIFFTFDPCGSRILHSKTFRTSLDLSPKDPRFPHSAILHAICASASRWAHGYTSTVDEIRRDTFAEYHSGKTRQYIDHTMGSGADIFHVLQACVILSWYFYSEGRWVEVWIFAGFQTRVAVPLRLNHAGTFNTQGGGSPGAYLAPAKDKRELESRRRTWWMAIIFDRIASVGGWLHGIEYKYIATEFPLRRVDFEEDDLSAANYQQLHTPDVYTTHPPEYTDSFLLLLKAIMLFGRVTDFNTEFQLRNFSPLVSDVPLDDPLFVELDQLNGEAFIGSMPEDLRTYPQKLRLVILHPETFDTDLYLVHLIPHAATITLHNPFLDFEKPMALSTRRCYTAAQAILDALLVFVTNNNASASIEFHPLLVRLHPFATICWYLSAVVKVQVCKRMIEAGDEAGELQTWREINALRMAMIQYGSLSPIGIRQERLLRSLMDGIVRNTRHEKPLEIGVPLYIHSHKTAFESTAARSQGTSPDVGAPLPAQSAATYLAESSHMQGPSLQPTQNGGDPTIWVRAAQSHRNGNGGTQSPSTHHHHQRTSSTNSYIP